MPALAESVEVDGFAWCAAKRGTCEYGQVPVKLRRDVYAKFFVEGGATEKQPHDVESTTEYLTFVHAEDATCSKCGAAKEKSLQPRRRYEDDGSNPAYEHALKIAEDNRVERLEQQVAALLAEREANG